MRVNQQAVRLYRHYFKRDLMGVMEHYAAFPQRIKIEKIAGIRLAQIIWIFAKNANPKLPSFNKWLNSIKELPIYEIFPEIAEKIAIKNVKQSKVKR